jgi:predicted transposase YbfD/YdcC
MVLRVMQFCRGGLSLPTQAWIAATCGERSVEATSFLMEVALMPFGPLLAALDAIQDPRRPQGQRYSPSPLLLFSVLAVLAGATSYQKIITFIAVRRDRLNTTFGACFRRAPAVNTLRRPLLTLDQDDLEGAFRRHARELNGTVRVTGKRTIALDGKTLRGSFDHLNDRAAADVLSAFASDAALILAHLEVAGSPGEIPAVATLMEELGLTGVLFTADALHCQKDAFTRAAETGNALLVRVKDNQPTSHDRLAGLCAGHQPFDSHETVDRRRHGRQEHRRVEVFDTAGHLGVEWQPLIACVARVSRLTFAKDTRSGLWASREEIGCYACQIRLDAKTLARAVRSHWGIENRDHYVRDVTLGEDDSRIRHRPGGMARIRSAALNILRAKGVQNVSQALYVNALNLDRLLALGSS